MNYNSFNIHAESLTLRPLQANDSVFFTALHQDPLTCLYACEPLSTEQAATRFKFFIHHNRLGSMLSFVIQSPSNEKPIGLIALTWSKRRPEVELGILLLSDYFGQGIAKKALKAILDFAYQELHLNVIMLRTHPENVAMLKVVEKLAGKSIKICEPAANLAPNQSTLSTEKKSLHRLFNIHYIKHNHPLTD